MFVKSWLSRRQLNYCKPLQKSFALSQIRCISGGFDRPDFHATTILNVRKGDEVVMIADGQISLGDTVFKNTARKLRRIDHVKGTTMMGFAGSAADCLALMELLEKEMQRYPGQTLRACLSLAS